MRRESEDSLTYDYWKEDAPLAAAILSGLSKIPLCQGQKMMVDGRAFTNIVGVRGEV